MSKKVLIVDDAYFMRNLLKKHLKEAGYEVIGEAKNGKEGIKLYFELNPDFITMDINMPDISGIEVTKQILSKDPNALIIAVTGNNDDEIKRQIMEAGAKEYLQKPFQPAYLWNKLDKMLATPVVEETIVEAKESVDTPKQTPVSTLVIKEAVEDNLDDDMEIEIMDKPDERKSATLVIQNEEDTIEYPESYQAVVDEQQKVYSLSKEKLEEEKQILVEEDTREIVLELESESNNNDSLIELESDNSYIELEEERIPVEKQEYIPEETVIPQPIRRPLVEQPVAPQRPIAPPKPISPPRPRQDVRPPIVPSVPYEPKREQQEVTRTVQAVVTSEKVVESKSGLGKGKKTKSKTGVEEITIRPESNYQTTSKEIDIRPPRAKFLNEDYPIHEEEVEEPILNVSEDDSYNEKSSGLFGVVKKLFKK